MQVSEQKLDCQLRCVHCIAEGRDTWPRGVLLVRLKLSVWRWLGPDRQHAFRAYVGRLIDRLSPSRRRRVAQQAVAGQATALQAGDTVQVRSWPEIETTLDHWRRLKGCTFMPEMLDYCGTTQRVLKPLERFVDERDLRVKRTRGIVLLEGVCCKGTAEFGRCDRSCYLFWRVEWLRKVDQSAGSHP